jgi:superfamily II RNA helicase
MRQDIMRGLRRNHRSTKKIFLYPFDSKLDDADNAVAAIRQDFQDFLGTLPAKLLISEQVNDIEAEDFEALKQEYERKKQRLREENERIQADLERVRMEFLAELPFNFLKIALGRVLF